MALLSQEDGLIPKLIDKMEINVEHFTENAKRHLAARTKVSGSSAQVYVGNDLNKVLSMLRTRQRRWEMSMFQ